MTQRVLSEKLLVHFFLPPSSMRCAALLVGYVYDFAAKPAQSQKCSISHVRL